MFFANNLVKYFVFMTKFGNSISYLNIPGFLATSWDLECFRSKKSLRGLGWVDKLGQTLCSGGIISLSIKKLAERAKSPPCQPRLLQCPLCEPWQPQAVTGSIMCTLAAPGCHRVNKIHPGSPRLLKGAKSDSLKQLESQ